MSKALRYGKHSIVFIFAVFILVAAAGCKQSNDNVPPADTPDWKSWPQDGVWAAYGLSGIQEPASASGTFRGGWNVNRFDLDGITVSMNGITGTEFDTYRSNLETEFSALPLVFSQAGSYFNKAGASSDMYTSIYQNSGKYYTIFISRANQAYTIDKTSVPENRMDFSVLDGYAGTAWLPEGLLANFGFTGIDQPDGTTVEASVATSSAIQLISLTGMTGTVYADFKAELESATGETFTQEPDDGGLEFYLMQYTIGSDTFILSTFYSTADSSFLLYDVKVSN
ncbi:hypothetical protein K7I13_10190 [Brucepastera parasyntrophica]|uniref:hypothetical protein n=1 Tax=Brucepastera parasyntrophica TaxID=2880008 RepID=UPI00210CFBD6|nr:hypothetical protein [Brucepastera parasyntrophica]ULQ58895.1 hypothetical protein K7I13_10190 [Brucepastera parasyntrophica]